VNAAKLEELRDRIYRRTQTRRVKTMRDAAKFIDAVGFCLLFASAHKVELPSLFEAVKGRRDAHIDDWDADSDRVWVWKNDLPASKRAYYGKAVAGKPVFVSLKMLPYLCALNARDARDADAYRHGRISPDAKRVYDVLRERGPMPTMALRAAAGFGGDTNRYHRALDDLQRALAVLPVGAVIERGAWASQIFGLVAQWFPREVELAERIDLSHARREIVRRYVQTVVTAKEAPMARLFGMARADVKAAADELILQHALKRDGDWLVANEKR
jgi:hypothetical protein